MKAFIYTGAAIMAGAVIYGLIDYKTSSNAKEFKNLYKTEEQVKKEDVANTATGKSQTTFVPVAIFNDDNKIDMKPTSVKTSTANTSGQKSVLKKKKVLNYKLFSRAALDEKYIQPADSATRKISRSDKQ